MTKFSLLPLVFSYFLYSNTVSAEQQEIVKYPTQYVSPNCTLLQRIIEPARIGLPAAYLERRNIFLETLAVVDNNGYDYTLSVVDKKKKTAHVTLSPNTIAQMQQGTVRVEHPAKISANARNKHETTVKVYNGDTLVTTLALQKEKGLNPCALNLADEVTAGGVVFQGFPTQEESLFRRTTLFKSLFVNDNLHLKIQCPEGIYNVPEHGVIYSPHVNIIRNSKNQFCSLEECAIISSAALDLSGTGKTSTYEADMKERIRAILRESHHHGHDSVVLGAYGCGAFQNNPEDVSRFFSDVFNESEFQGVFKEIAFAIFDDKEGKHGKSNYKTFHTMFPG